MNIYLSAPIRGVKDGNRPIFNKAKTQLEAKGHVVFSPPRQVELLKLAWPSGKPTVKDYFLMDTEWILTQAHLVLTIHPNWRDSKGCRAEVALAVAVGVPVTHATWTKEMILVF